MFYYTEQNIVTFEFNKNVSRVCSEPFWANVSLLDNIWRNTCCLFPEVAIIWLKSSTQYRLEQYWQDCSASSPRIEIFTVVWSEGSELLPSGATCVKISTTSFRPERESTSHLGVGSRISLKTPQCFKYSPILLNGYWGFPLHKVIKFYEHTPR